VGYVATGMLYGPAARRFMTGDGGGSRDRQADSAQASVPPSSEFLAQLAILMSPPPATTSRGSVEGATESRQHNV